MSKSIFLLLTLSFVAVSCSSVQSTMKALESPSLSYRNYLEDHLRVGESFDRGRRLVAIKALLANENLKAEQEKLSPGFSFPHESEHTQVIVAVTLAHPGSFTKADLKFTLNEASATRITEFTSSPEIQTFYPFAYPFYRVFLVAFPKQQTDQLELSLKSARGPVSVAL